MSEGHGPSQKPSARTKSSGQIPQLPAKGGGPPKPGSTSRIKPATVRPSKAETQLSDEVNAKGIRLVKTLASIDAAFWKASIGMSREERKKKMEFLLQKLNTEQTAAARENVFRQNPELKTMYDQLVDPLGPLSTLKGDKRDVGPGQDILQITVVDVSGGDSGSGSVQAVDNLGQQGLSLFSSRTEEDVTIGDGRDKGSGQDVRLYTMVKE